jgi:hypothetical protein
MRHHPLLVLLAALSLVGCPKADEKKADEKKTDDKAKAGDEKAAKKKAKGDEAADDDDEKPKKKKAKGDEAADDDEKPKKKPVDDGSRDVAGVGKIPAYAKDAAVTDKCTTPVAIATKIKALEKGDDATVTDGSVDLVKLDADLAGSCRATAPKALASALNDGGMKHYSKGKMEEANRWWRAALTVRPANAISRYNLACGLAKDGKKDDAIWALAQLGLQAKDGDESAANYLEKAKSDSDLEGVRNEADFKAAVKMSDGAWVGPRRETETSKDAVKLLPKDFLTTTHPATEEKWTYKPALLDLWTWRPDADHEFIVAQLTDDPAMVGKPKGDMNVAYGAIAVFQRDASWKLSLVASKKLGEEPPKVAHTKANTVEAVGQNMCGDNKATLSFAGGKVVMTVKECGK